MRSSGTDATKLPPSVRDCQLACRTVLGKPLSSWADCAVGEEFPRSEWAPEEGLEDAECSCMIVCDIISEAEITTDPGRTAPADAARTAANDPPPSSKMSSSLSSPSSPSVSPKLGPLE